MSQVIVIIEDEALLLKALNIELLSAGFQVFSALDGEMGIRIIKEKKPDLILLDLLIPKLSGFAILRQLKEDPLYRNIPVIILSNMEQKEDRIRAFELDAADYFIKSNTDLSLLAEKINTILQNKKTDENKTKVA